MENNLQIDDIDPNELPIHIRGYLIAELGVEEGSKEYKKIADKHGYKRIYKGKSNGKIKKRDKIALTDDSYSWA